MSGVVADAPLIVAANRDERMDRPAIPITVLSNEQPRILGGRDQLAGGTWLAVNEHGVVAGLTNQPSAEGRDPSKRSRGELPIAFAGWMTAADAVDGLTGHLDPAVYNPCWLLIGDRDTLYFVGISGRPGKAEVEQLGQGVYVLENAPLHPVSAKAAKVTRLIGEALAVRPGLRLDGDPAVALRPAGAVSGGPATDEAPAAVVAALETILGSHEPAIHEPRTGPGGRIRRPALSAPCVHADGYGTRSAMTISVPARQDARPRVRVAEGRPCEAPFGDVTSLWA